MISILTDENDLTHITVLCLLGTVGHYLLVAGFKQKTASY